MSENRPTAPVRRIIVGLGGTPHSIAVAHHAVELAQIHQAQLLGLTVVDPDAVAAQSSFTGGTPALQRLMTYTLPLTESNVQRAIDEFKQICAGEEVDFAVQRHEGKPLDVLAELARYHDLVALGLRGLFEYGVVRQREEFLVRLINSGVRPIFAAGPRYREIRRVAIGFNGSAGSAAAMKQFIQMNPWPGVDVDLLCLELPQEKARRTLEDAADYLSVHGWQPQIHIRSDVESRRLWEEGQRLGADLIVLGSSERSLIRRKTLGDVLLYTVLHSELPLFIA